MLSIIVFSNNDKETADIISSAIDVSSFSVFSRSTVKSCIIAFSREISQRVKPGYAVQAEEGSYVLYARSNCRGNLTAVCATDSNYSHRVAFNVCSLALKNHSPSGIEFLLKRFQNPREADAISSIHSEIEETKILMHQNIKDLLERGQSLDELVEKSNDLTLGAKEFYKASRGKRCCSLSA